MEFGCAVNSYIFFGQGVLNVLFFWSKGLDKKGFHTWAIYGAWNRAIGCQGKLLNASKDYKQLRNKCFMALCKIIPATNFFKLNLDA